MPATEDAVVVLPVKAFGSAKSRLADVLDDRARTVLARTMAEQVLSAAGSMPVVVACDDEQVAAWAVERGADVVWTVGLDLNGSVSAGIDAVAARSGPAARAVVAHADLPFATRLDRVVEFDGATVVPDRRDDGTNVLCVPVGAGFRPSYGPGSFQRHVAHLRHDLGLAVHVARLADLQWDVDEPGDLPER